MCMALFSKMICQTCTIREGQTVIHSGRCPCGCEQNKCQCGEEK
jgi:hypothetical protein